nr:MAG TPA: hypothetical protein [Caudoviricetes sp.]
MVAGYSCLLNILFISLSQQNHGYQHRIIPCWFS